MTAQDYELTKAPNRYELIIGGEVAGFAEYMDRGGVRTMPHTVIAPKFRGQGLSNPLIKYALDNTRADGMKVNPTCWAVAGFMDKNPEYADLRP